MRKLKIKFVRFWRNIHADKDYPSTDSHLTAASIFRRALRERGVELIIMPYTNKRIIKVDRKGLFIVLQHTILEITNHKYSYHLDINYDMYTKLIKLFDAKLQSINMVEEEIINQQLQGGLKKVLELFNK
jgi:hypothetical protein